MPKERPSLKPELPPLTIPTDEDDEYIRQVIEEGYIRKGGVEEEIVEGAFDFEGALDPEELMGGLGPKGRARAEAEKKRKMS
jgi:hypothetical protein